MITKKEIEKLYNQCIAIQDKNPTYRAGWEPYANVCTFALKAIEALEFYADGHISFERERDFVKEPGWRARQCLALLGDG